MDPRTAGARAVDATSARSGGAALLGGFCSVAAYGIVLWAMTRAPVAAVAALRETSVLFAALIGTVLLKEGFGLRAPRWRSERGRGRGRAQILRTRTRMPSVPTQAQVVIVGGGIAGASTAYHLAKLGITDVVLLEQGKLTCGTTWHAAGLVGQTRATRNATRMSQYGIELYSTLEAETGLATGWKQCGSLNVAKTPERLQLMQAADGAREELRHRRSNSSRPPRPARIAPILRTDDLAGAVWIPGDGKANPTDLTQSLAKGARMRGAKHLRGRARSPACTSDDGRVAGVTWSTRAKAPATISCETLVNCAGQWAREFGRTRRRQRAAVRGRALLHRHQADRRASRPTCR